MMGELILDFERRDRCGVEEAVFCEYKSPQQIDTLVAIARHKEKRLLLTRLSAKQFAQLSEMTRANLYYSPTGRVAVLGEIPDIPSSPSVAIVSAGASDAPVCDEIAITLKYHGIANQRFEDLGVSALWRLQQRLPDIIKHSVIIAVAGMEAALPTILAGMVPHAIIAVPTSVGYGVSQGGHLALQACLGSCAAGILSVNIDNGFGAACAAIKILHSANSG